MGRFVCGWLCPFGLVQDLLYKIPGFKKIKTFKYDKALRKLKYVILIVFVIILPLFLVDVLGQGSPYFCKLICPVGMLEGGIPLVLLNKTMRSRGLGDVYKRQLLEGRDTYSNYTTFNHGLQTFLQVYLPTGSNLFSVQSNFYV